MSTLLARVGIGLGIVLAGCLCGYFYGRHDGWTIRDSEQRRVDAAIATERARREQLVDQVAAAASTVETNRQTAVREIYHETHTVTERPVYRNVCIDADGVRLLDTAAAAANGQDRGIGTAGAGTGPSGPAPF